MELEAMHSGPGPSKWRGSRKLGERLILEELEKGSGTFTELKNRCDLADSTLSDHLRTLEEKGDVTREYKERKLLIKLTDKTAKPIARALRHLGAIYPPLDIELGRKLLTDDVVDAILVISTLSPQNGETPNTPECPHPASWGCHKEEERKLEDIGFKLELDEYHLLKALARYDYERRRAGGVEYTGKASDLLKIGLQEWVERGAEVVMKKVSNPETFPALGVVRKRGVTEKLDALLEWIGSLVNIYSEEYFMKKPNGQYVIKWIVPPPSEGTRTGGIMSTMAHNGKIGVYIQHNGVLLLCEINEANLETEMDQLSKVLVPTDVDKEGAYELRTADMGKPKEAADLALIKATLPPDMKPPKPNNLAEAVFYNEGNEYHEILKSVKGMPRRRAKIASYPPRLNSFLDRYLEKEREKEKERRGEK